MTHRSPSPTRDRDRLWLYTSALLWGFGMSLFIYLQPLYIAQLGATPAQIGLALGLSGLPVTLIYIPAGLWADRRGRKPVILAGWLLGTLATLAMALAPDWRWFIPAQAVYLFSNFAVPAFQGYIAASETHGKLNRTFTLIASGHSLGSIISPAIGGWIGEQFGLRVVYWCAAVVFGFSTLALWPLSNQPIEAPRVVASPKQLLSNRQFLWQVVFIFLLFFAIEIGPVMAPKFLEDVRGLNVGQIGWLGTLGSLGIVLLTLALGQIPEGRSSSLLLGQAAALTALILLVSAPAWPLIGLAYFIHGSNRIVRPLTMARLAGGLDPATVSFGLGFHQTAMQLGLSVAPYVAGLLYTYHPAWPLYAGVVGLTLTLLLTFTLPASAPVLAQTSSVQGLWEQ